MLHPKIALTLALPCAFLATARLFAGEEIDLNRLAPVPADQPIPISDFFRPLVLQQPELNLSGSHFAAIISAGADQHELLVVERKTNQLDRLFPPSDKDINSFAWLDDQHLIFTISAKKLFNLGLFSVQIGKLGEAHPILQYYGSHLIAVRPRDRLHPLVWNAYDSIDAHRDLGAAVINTTLFGGGLVDIFQADVNNNDIADAREYNENHIIESFPTPPSGLTLRYLADKEGQLEFAETMEDGVATLFHLADKKWEKCPVDLEKIDVICCGNEPGQLVVRGPRQAGKPCALQFMDGPTGQLGTVLLQDDTYDFYGPGIGDGWIYRDPNTHIILGAMFERAWPATVWFSPGYRDFQKELERSFPGQVIHILGSDEAQKVFLIGAFSDRQPTIYSWVDRENKTAGLIKKSRPWIDPQRMQPMKIIRFKTRDGHQLDAYLTLPAGATKQNPPPLVVMPHGGPWARDSWGFDADVQFLASRGYAVLQPNYRGSNGYCWMFPIEDAWNFSKMHDDVTDATRAIIGSKLVDPDRVAIMGGSFGGYLAIMGVVNEPQLYRCAVTIAGVFDWAQLIKDKKHDRFDSSVYGRLIRKLGDPGEQPGKFDAIAPGRHVDRIRVPVFVSHGKDDPIVDISQSRRLVSALEENHVPHESYLAYEEGHGMGHLTHQVELYGRIEAFLAKYLAPTKPAAPAAP